MGAAIQADDLCTISSSIESTASQANTTDSCHKLNASKLEIVSTQPFESETVQLNDVSVDTSSSAKVSVYGGDTTYLLKDLLHKISTKPGKLFRSW